MRRWNGWGDESISMPLPPAAAPFLAARIGPGTAPSDAALESVLASVPASRLPEHPLLSTDRLARLRHARGQSLPDWVALRSGRVGTFPDGVATPNGEEEVRDLLRLAAQAGARLVPYGGGTSVVGHVNPLPGERPVLTVDMGRMNRLVRLDAESQLATFGAGILGPELEAHLRPHGFTLGHFPQSFEFSTLGGWIATRSSGQQSLRYGRIESVFAGGRLESPAGPLTLPALPASAAGPDLRQLVLGSEGRLGILTEATVRVTPLSTRERFEGIFFPTWEEGCEAVRGMLQARLPLSMLRLSNARETETSLVLAGHTRLVALLSGYVSARGAREGRCLLLLGTTGSRAASARREAHAITRRHAGVAVGTSVGRGWAKNRFLAPYLRNTLWAMGYAVDTLETAVTWDRLEPLHQAIEGALAGALSARGETVHVFTHLSHGYADGSSLYTTYVFRLAPDPDETLERWRLLKTAASEAIVRHGGTISHQHGVGLDHLPYVLAEKGELGVRALAGLCKTFDPEGVMNPGKLLPST